MKYSFVIIFTIVFQTLSCEMERDLFVSVEVLDNMKNPVDGADVSINNHHFGKTNSNGILDKSYSFYEGTTLQIEITKKSKDHYFAPYFEKYSYTDMKDLNKIKVRAILYQIPKNPMIPKKIIIPDDSVDQKGDLHVNKNNDIDIDIDIDQKNLQERIKKNIEKSDSEEMDSLANPMPHESIAIKYDKLFSDIIVLPPFSKHEAKTDFVLQKQTSQPSTFFYLSVHSGSLPVHGADVYLGYKESGQLKFLCKTNEDGKCQRSIIWPQSDLTTIKIQRSGFITKTISQRISKKNIIKTNLLKGRSLDVFVHKYNYSGPRGIAEIDLYINHKKIGQTDSFGHFVWEYSGAPDELIKLSFRKKNYLPEYYVTDFVFSENQTVQKSLADNRYHAPVLAITEVLNFIPSSSEKAFQIKYDALKSMTVFLRKTIEKSDLFKIMSNDVFSKYLHGSGSTIETALFDGWEFLNLKSKPDYILVPVITNSSNKIELFLNIINQKGDLECSVSADLNILDHQSPDQINYTAIINKLFQQFPFHGTLLGSENSSFIIKFDKRLQSFIDKRKKIHIFGTALSSSGQSQSPVLIAKGHFNPDSKEQAGIQWKRSRSIISRGDLLVFNRDDDQKVDIPVYKNQKNSIVFIETSPPGGRVEVDGLRSFLSPGSYTTNKNKDKMIRLKMLGPPGYDSQNIKINITKSIVALRGPHAFQFIPSYMKRAMSFYDQKKWDLALISLDKIPLDHIDKATALYISAVIYLKYIKDYKKSSEKFSQAISLIKSDFKRYSISSLLEAKIGLASSLIAETLEARRLHIPDKIKELNEVLMELRNPDIQDNLNRDLIFLKSFIDLVFEEIMTRKNKNVYASELHKKWLDFMVISKSNTKNNQQYSQYMIYAKDIAKYYSFL